MIRGIKLSNWKSHTETELSFVPGTNVIVGPMGAGKSSVLQAITFALFGTFPELKRKDLKISDLVRRGSELKQSQIDLEIENGDAVLKIKRIIDEGSTKEAAVRSKEGKLLAGTNPAQVNAYLKDVLKLDEDVFLRTIYAKQNEIDLFLQLTPNERKARLDELMGLNKFEDARKNCVRLANHLETKKESQEEFIRDFKVETLEDEINQLIGEIQNLGIEKESLKSHVVTIDKEKSELDEQIKNLRKNFEEFSRLEEKRNMLQKQLDELAQNLSAVALEEDLQSVNFSLREVKTKLAEIQRSKSALKEDLERHQKNALELEKRFGVLEHKSAELSEALEQIEKLRADLQGLEKDGKLIFLEGRIQAIRENLRRTADERSQILGEINVLKKHLADLEATEGTCPVCATALEYAKKAELISQRNQKIAELQQRTQVLQEEIENVRKTEEYIEGVYEKQREIVKRIEQMEDLLREEREVAIQLSEAKGKREMFAEIIQQMQQRLDTADIEIQNLDVDYTRLNELKHLCELKDKENQIRSELERVNKEFETKVAKPDELEILENKFMQAIKYAQELESKANSLEYVVEEKGKRLKDFEDKKNRYLEIKDKIKVYQEKVEFLSQFKNALLSAQESLRKELILAVNEVMSNLWTQLYPYDKWTSIKLDATEDDYILQLKEQEGSWITVAGFASGGERMIACLTLRLAFAKVLAQNMNILILDEPTHNLDDRAIATLVEVIQNRLSGFLDQLFIVTHDEKLAEAGDNIIRIK